MNDLINTLRMYAEDMHSAFGHGYCSEAMSRAADLLEEQKGTIAALNIVLGGADSTSTENLIGAHEFDIADVGLIAVCRRLMSEISELEASPLSEEALDILRSKNKQLEQERDQLKEDYQRTCHLVAQMHMAAMNGVIGPKRGVIEDIADLREERDSLAAQNEAMQKALNKIHDIAAPYDDWVKFGYIKELALEGLQLPGLAAEVLKRRDAETLRRAADRFEAVDPHPKHWDWLRRNAAELEKETT